INVSDLEASRAFYRDFVGLEELPPVDAPVLGTRLYPYRNGETTIMLFHTGGDVPNDDGSAGIQYIVGDAAMVDAKAKRRGGIGVQTPLNKLNGFDLTTIWLSDPDGVTNYFAQVGPNSRTAQQARAED
ncbi:MAG TPA: VOC family protein, partial [Alteraurantiacibacter sp.]